MPLDPSRGSTGLVLGERLLIDGLDSLEEYLTVILLAQSRSLKAITLKLCIVDLIFMSRVRAFFESKLVNVTTLVLFAEYWDSANIIPSAGDDADEVTMFNNFLCLTHLPLQQASVATYVSDEDDSFGWSAAAEKYKQVVGANLSSSDYRERRSKGRNGKLSKL